MKFLHGYKEAETTGQFLRWAFTMIAAAAALMVAFSVLSSIAGHWDKSLGGALLEAMFALMALIASFAVLVYMILVSMHVLREAWNTRP